MVTEELRPLALLCIPARGLGSWIEDTGPGTGEGGRGEGSCYRGCGKGCLRLQESQGAGGDAETGRTMTLTLEKGKEETIQTLLSWHSFLLDGSHKVLEPPPPNTFYCSLFSTFSSPHFLHFASFSGQFVAETGSGMPIERLQQ